MKEKTDSIDKPLDNKDCIRGLLKNIGKMRYFIVIEGIAVGAFGGGCVVLFRYGLEKIQQILPYIIRESQAHPWVIAVWFCVLALAALVTRFLVFMEPMIGGSGIPQVAGEMRGYFDLVWWRVLIAKITGGLITLGCGLCLGREGPSVQIGAMAGKGVSRLTGRPVTEERILLTCGASAGLAAAFNAPLAGVIFDLEEIHKNYSLYVLLPAISSSITADLVSRRVFGLDPVFDFTGAGSIETRYFWIVLLMAVAVGIVGVAYNACIAKAQDLYDKIGRMKAGGYLRTVLPFLCCGAVTFLIPQALGGGSELVMDISTGAPLRLLFILLILRFFYSIISFASGVPGGIFLPLLTLGALCGGITHGIADAAGIDISLACLMAVAMAAAFSAIVRSPVTGIVLLIEMTGDLELLIFMAGAALVAYITADLLGAEPVYEQLLHRILMQREQTALPSRDKKVTTEISVEIGSKACGKKVSEMNMPEGCLIVSISRGGREIIPDGGTMIEPLDDIEVVCSSKQLPRVRQILESRCRARL